MSFRAAKTMAATGGNNARRNVARWRIEGEYVTYREMGRRLGITEIAARDRHKLARKAPGAVTWERLRR